MNWSFTTWLTSGIVLGVIYGQAVIGDLTVGLGFGLSWGIMFFFMFGKRK
jgi:hypothetical protein